MVRCRFDDPLADSRAYGSCGDKVIRAFGRRGCSASAGGVTRTWFLREAIKLGDWLADEVVLGVEGSAELNFELVLAVRGSSSLKVREDDLLEVEELFRRGG